MSDRAAAGEYQDLSGPAIEKALTTVRIYSKSLFCAVHLFLILLSNSQFGLSVGFSITVISRKVQLH